MKHAAANLVLISISFLFCTWNGTGQIIDLNSKHPYKKVFVETDNFGTSYLSILEDAVNKVQNDTLKFSLLNDLAYYWHTRDLNTALNFTKKGLALTRESRNKLWEGRFQITQGAILLRMEKLDSAKFVLEDAKTKVLQKDLPFLNTQLGYVFERRGELGKAADYALISLGLGEKLGDKKAIAMAYSDLSNLFWKQSKIEKGLEFGLKSVKLFEERGLNDLDYDFTLYVVGNNYLDMGKHQDALNYFKHAIAIGERYGFYNNLSDIYISLTDLHSYLGQYKKAEEAGNNAVKYAELLNNNFMLMRSWLSIGKLQNLQGKYLSAIESLQKCIAIATPAFGDEFYLSQAYEALGKAYVGNHNYKDAYAAFESYDRLKKQIFTAEADQRISKLLTEFDVADMNNTIQVQGIKIKHQRLIQTLVIIISCLLLLLLLVLYILYKNNKKKNKLLQKQNQEKEFLLKEIHHRVKNNLEIISSLLSLQSAQIRNPEIRDFMKDSRNRVYSMSMIHQKLYQGKTLSAIDMKDYLINLAEHIMDSFQTGDRINLTNRVDPVELDVDSAIPIGLIVNELITNALKYAFPNKSNGTIEIVLQKMHENKLFLEVADDGIGQAEGHSNKDGFGTQLINLLVQQMDGIKYDNTKNGTKISFELNLNSL